MDKILLWHFDKSENRVVGTGLMAGRDFSRESHHKEGRLDGNVRRLSIITDYPDVYSVSCKYIDIDN